jgi:hypothetical protein
MTRTKSARRTTARGKATHHTHKKRKVTATAATPEFNDKENERPPIFSAPSGWERWDTWAQIQEQIDRAIASGDVARVQEIDIVATYERQAATHVVALTLEYQRKGLLGAEWAEDDDLVLLSSDLLRDLSPECARDYALRVVAHVVTGLVEHPPGPAVLRSEEGVLLRTDEEGGVLLGGVLLMDEDDG